MKSSFCILAVCSTLAACTSQSSLQSAYVGQETRSIKALPQAEIDGLLAGKGLGYAKSAELNGYPGPAHVLELADRLALTPDQLAKTNALFVRMQTAAKLHGTGLVQAETDLEALFRSGNIQPNSLSQAVDKVALFQSKVRSAHLSAHIEQKALLTEQQVKLYTSLRGYGGSHSHSGHH